MKNAKHGVLTNLRMQYISDSYDNNPEKVNAKKSGIHSLITLQLHPILTITYCDTSYNSICINHNIAMYLTIYYPLLLFIPKKKSINVHWYTIYVILYCHILTVFNFPPPRQSNTHCTPYPSYPCPIFHVSISNLALLPRCSPSITSGSFPIHTFPSPYYHGRPAM